MTDDARASMQEADCIIFDCDGVLVDVSDSYYAAIAETARYVLADVFKTGIGTDAIVTRDTIDRFKGTGRFNDEIDLTCAIIAAAVMAKDTGRTYADVTNDIIRNAASGGIAQVLQYTRGVAGVSDVIRYMEHPSPGRNGRLCSIFDQIFFGPDMYRKVRSRQADIKRPGMIERDKVIVTDRILRSLAGRFERRMALVTGRGLHAARYTLGPLLQEWFDVENSAFLEDEPRGNAKPNPARLDECICNMGAKKTIYVGDSIEDLIMARNASSDVIFCGIADHDTWQKDGGRGDALIRAGAQIVMDSVPYIPKALNLDG